MANCSQCAMRTPLKVFQVPLPQRAASKKMDDFQPYRTLAPCWDLCVNLPLARYLFHYACFWTFSLARTSRAFLVRPSLKVFRFLWGPWPIAVNLQKELPEKCPRYFCNKEQPARKWMIFSPTGQSGHWLPAETFIGGSPFFFSLGFEHLQKMLDESVGSISCGSKVLMFVL